MKKFNGKAIYNPSGKAGEYSYWACNFYVGCSNDCEYCYCKKGLLKGTMGGDKPTLKKCFKNEEHALAVFINEMNQNLPELQKNGIFFSFTTDPMLEETIMLTLLASNFCHVNHIPVYILTKTTWWLKGNADFPGWAPPLDYAIIGFTLTGHDELEPGASSNLDRLKAMRHLHRTGYKTFASIEPIIDFASAKDMIMYSRRFCDLYKIGLMSGKKYDIIESQSFVEWLSEFIDTNDGPKVYLKESLQKLSRYTNAELPDYFVERDYKLHLN